MRDDKSACVVTCMRLTPTLDRMAVSISLGL